MSEQPNSNGSNPSNQRKRGAPLANKNSLKHGFYAEDGLYDQLFKQSEWFGLDNYNITDLKYEINMLRAFIRRVLNMGNEIQNLAEAVDLLRALSLASTSLTRLIRTQSLLSANNDEIGQAIQQALEEVAKELGLADSHDS